MARETFEVTFASEDPDNKQLVTQSLIVLIDAEAEDQRAAILAALADKGFDPVIITHYTKRGQGFGALLGDFLAYVLRRQEVAPS